MQCWLIVHSVYECTVSIYAQFIYIVVCYLINIYHSLVPLSSVSLNKLAPCMHDTISTIYTAPNKSTPVKHVSVCVISHNFTLLSPAIAVNALSLSPSPHGIARVHLPVRKISQPQVTEQVRRSRKEWRKSDEKCERETVDFDQRITLVRDSDVHTEHTLEHV